MRNNQNKRNQVTFGFRKQRPERVQKQAEEKSRKRQGSSKGRVLAVLLLLVLLCNLCQGMQVQAAEDEFLIENGVLKSYQGTKTKVTIPKGVTEIEKRAFWGASNLKSVTTPKGVTVIGENAFGGCSKLKTITIPKSVTKIGVFAFSETVWMKNKQKKNPLVVVNKILIDGTTATGKITIPKGVKAIADSAFYRSNSELIIYGKVGSAAHIYAEEMGYSFVEQ